MYRGCFFFYKFIRFMNFLNELFRLHFMQNEII